MQSVALAGARRSSYSEPACAPGIAADRPSRRRSPAWSSLLPGDDEPPLFRAGRDARAGRRLASAVAARRTSAQLQAAVRRQRPFLVRASTEITAAQRCATAGREAGDGPDLVTDVAVISWQAGAQRAERRRAAPAHGLDLFLCLELFLVCERVRQHPFSWREAGMRTLRAKPLVTMRACGAPLVTNRLRGAACPAIRAGRQAEQLNDREREQHHADAHECLACLVDPEVTANPHQEEHGREKHPYRVRTCQRSGPRSRPSRTPPRPVCRSRRLPAVGSRTAACTPAPPGRSGCALGR